MKTIAVLTDLSKSSEHTAQYALHLAKKMKARIVFYQVCPAPVPYQLVTAAYTAEEADESSLLIEFDLQMSRLTAARTFTGSFLPEVTSGQSGTELVDVMTTIMQDDQIELIITGPGKEKDLAAYL